MSYEADMKWYPIVIITIVISYLIGLVYFINYMEKHKQEPKVNMNYQQQEGGAESADLDLLAREYKEPRQHSNNNN